jgi:ribosomal RNA assembly protein
MIAMQQFLIPEKRAKLLEDPSLVSSICARLGCEISLRDGRELVITGEPFDEYNAKNVMQAFARGFDIDTAYKLLSDDYFFKSINLKEIFEKKERIQRIKARIIGREGRAKEYMQSISGADLSVYGNTVSVIGTPDELRIISAALDILIEGGTHKKAYVVMEKTKKSVARR